MSQQFSQIAKSDLERNEMRKLLEALELEGLPHCTEALALMFAVVVALERPPLL